MSLRRRTVCLLLAASLTSPPALPATCTSKNQAGDWSDPNTWLNCGAGNGTVAGTPGSSDTAEIHTHAAGVISLTGPETVQSLTMSHHSDGVTALQFTGGNLTVTNLLTLDSGRIETNGYSLIVSGDCTTSVTIGGAGDWVIGNLRLTYPAGNATCTYPIGTSAVYTPISLTKTGTNTGTLTGTVASGDHAQVTAGVAGIHAGKSVNLYWTLTPGTLSANTPYSATFTYTAGVTDGSATAASFNLRKLPLNTASNSPGPWTTASLSGVPTATATTVTGLRTFGIYSIGEPVTTPNKAPYLHFRERF